LNEVVETNEVQGLYPFDIFCSVLMVLEAITKREDAPNGDGLSLGVGSDSVGQEMPFS
jgi:hypothetical protein